MYLRTVCHWRAKRGGLYGLAEVVSWRRLMEVLAPMAAWPTCTIFYAMAANRLSNTWNSSIFLSCFYTLCGYLLLRDAGHIALTSSWHFFW
jgi:hypothetical protein